MVRVLIAESDVQMGVHLSNVINFTKEAIAISIINDGSKAYQTIKIIKPEIVILDPEFPNQDGLEILRNIEKDEELKTKVIIHSKAEEYLYETIGFNVVEAFLDKSKPYEEVGLEVKKIAKEITDGELTKKIYELLFRIGFRPEHKGTRFMEECIKFSMKEKQENLKVIYEELATKTGKTAYTIKADIQGAVNKMWVYANKEKIRRFLRMGETEKPSPKLVVCMVKYYIEK